MLQLSDLHASWAVPMGLIERAIELGLAAEPDVVCLTGDFITHTADFDSGRLVEALRRLSRVKPTFAALGNHDGGRWAKQHRGFGDHAVVERMLEEAGVTLLHNRSAEVVTVRGASVRLVGVGDLWAAELDAGKAFREVKRRGPVVLLAHNPDSKEQVAGYDWDVMLSGHTHGGQVLVPFQGPRFAPVQDKRFVEGLRDWDGRRIFISRGVGNLGGVRLGCRPEVSVLDLASAG